MKLYSVCVDADFKDADELRKMEKKYELRIVDVTEYEIKECVLAGCQYRGPKIYMFIGDWRKLVNYFMYDYPLNDVDDLVELSKDIKILDF